MVKVYHELCVKTGENHFKSFIRVGLTVQATFYDSHPYEGNSL